MTENNFLACGLLYWEGQVNCYMSCASEVLSTVSPWGNNKKAQHACYQNRRCIGSGESCQT